LFGIPTYGHRADPVITDPFITDPVITDPFITDPVITDPDPVVTDPVITDPVVQPRALTEYSISKAARERSRFAATLQGRGRRNQSRLNQKGGIEGGRASEAEQ
jgi:hypothetical protein